MEKVSHKEKSRETIALVLIGIGLLWALKQTGGFFHFPFFHLENIFLPIREALHGVGHVLFSWPMVFIIVGTVLLAGKRTGGLVLLVIGAVFLLPKLIFISGAAVVLLFPLILIGFGVALIAKLI